MGKTININLFDPKSIQAVVKALKDYENSLEYKCRLLAETLAEKGIEIARVLTSMLYLHRNFCKAFIRNMLDP